MRKKAYNNSISYSFISCARKPDLASRIKIGDRKKEWMLKEWIGTKERRMTEPVRGVPTCTVTFWKTRLPSFY